MNAIFSGCSTLKQVLESIDAHLAQQAHGSATLDEAQRWCLRGIRRCLHALQDTTASFADRGVILREITRLAGGTLLLPIDGTGIGEEGWTGLRRYGVNARPQPNGQVRLLLQDDESLPDALKTALRLDPYPRRPPLSARDTRRDPAALDVLYPLSNAYPEGRNAQPAHHASGNGPFRYDAHGFRQEPVVSARHLVVALKRAACLYCRHCTNSRPGA